MGLDNSGLCEWIPRNSWITGKPEVTRLRFSASGLPTTRGLNVDKRGLLERIEEQPY
jgi:hypothetical protein